MGTTETQEYQGNVGIIYDGTRPESWDIRYFRELFEERGMGVVLFDANKLNGNYGGVVNPEEVSLPEVENLTKEGYMVWMNRVYPSEADASTINRSLNMVSWLSQKGIKTINPLQACKADYDKAFAYRLMNANGVPTPRTMVLTRESGLESIFDVFSLPLVVKRRTGGKGIDVMKVEERKTLRNFLEEKEESLGRYLVQDFVESSGDHDIRVGVIEGNPLISYGRTLVPVNGEKPWMASCNHGSQIIPYQASEEECDLAVRASEAIGANLNEVDIQITEEGPIVIENNPTPGYDAGEEHWVKLIVDHIVRSEVD